MSHIDYTCSDDATVSYVTSHRPMERRASCIAAHLCVQRREYESEPLLVVHYSWQR